MLSRVYVFIVAFLIAGSAFSVILTVFSSIVSWPLGWLQGGGVWVVLTVALLTGISAACQPVYRYILDDKKGLMRVFH